MKVLKTLIRKKPSYPAIVDLTEEEINVFLRYVKTAKRSKKAKVLVVGESPIVRRMCAYASLLTTVVHDNLHSLRVSGGKQRTNEIWLEGFVEKLPLKKKAYDFVFSERLVWEEVKKRRKFFTRIAELLKTGGLAVLRFVVNDKERKSLERRLEASFKIKEVLNPRKGAFSKYFPVYVLRPKRKRKTS